MPRFVYQARAINGQVQRGELVANSEAEVKIRLQGQGYTILKISQAGVKPAAQKKGQVGFFTPRVKGAELKVFVRQFSTLVNAGIPVVDALKILADGLPPGVLKQATSEVKVGIEGGRKLADSMSLQPHVFDRLFVNLIQAGEEGGKLDSIMARLSIYIEKAEKIKKQITGALVYPAIVMVISIAVILLILIYVIPKFEEFYKMGGKEPPWLTQVVVSASRGLVEHKFVVLGVIIAVPIALKYYLQQENVKRSLERILLKAPLFGPVIQKASLARLSRTMATMLSSGIGLIEAIEISGKTSGNIVIEEALMKSKEGVMGGKPLSVCLHREKIIPDMVIQMIAIGEQSGKMDEMLSKVADFYEDEVENAVKTLTSMLEPLMMVFLGTIIAVLVTAMYLPIFNLGDVVQ